MFFFCFTNTPECFGIFFSYRDERVELCAFRSVDFFSGFAGCFEKRSSADGTKGLCLNLCIFFAHGQRRVVGKAHNHTPFPPKRGGKKFWGHFSKPYSFLSRYLWKGRQEREK
jgi:hypothetical protein